MEYTDYNIYDSFLKADYDSFHNFIYVIKNNIITYGNQLLGVIFFFVPRSYWPNKPIGSGAQIAMENEFLFSNISMNYFAEGYINYGIIGISIFTIVIAKMNKILDVYHWKVQNSYFTAMYLFIIGMEFFILRGDLLSSIAYTTGIILSTLFIMVILKK